MPVSSMQCRYRHTGKIILELLYVEISCMIISPLTHYYHLKNDYMIGLINTTYSVGGIVIGWFFSGPIVSGGVLIMVRVFG
jgi:hypothetical protein